MDVSRDFYVALDVVYGFATKGRNGSIKETKKLDEARSILVTRFSDVVKEYEARSSFIAGLEKSLEDARKRLDHVRSERDDLREGLELKVREVQELRRPIDEHTKPLHSEIESLKLGLEEMGKRANAEHIARLNADGAAKRANEQASGLLTRIADQKAEIDRLKVSLDSQSSVTSLERNRADTEHIRHQNASRAANEALQERDEARKRLAEVEGAYRGAKQLLEQALEQRDLARDEAAAFRQQLTELRSSVMARDVEEHNALVRRLRSEIETQRGAKERNAAELAEAKRDANKMAEQVEHLRHQLGEARTSYERLAQELTKTKADLITARVELDTYLKSRVEVPAAYANRLSYALDESKSRTEHALALAKDWERIATDRFDDITRLNRRVAHLETELSEIANDADVRRERAKDMVDDIMEAAAVRGVLRAEDSEKVDARPERQLEASVAPPAHGKVWVLLKGREDVVTFDGDERCLGTYAEALKSGQPFTYIESGGSQHLIPVAKIEALSFRPDESMKRP